MRCKHLIGYIVPSAIFIVGCFEGKPGYRWFAPRKSKAEVKDDQSTKVTSLTPKPKKGTSTSAGEDEKVLLAKEKVDSTLERLLQSVKQREESAAQVEEIQTKARKTPQISDPNSLAAKLRGTATLSESIKPLPPPATSAPAPRDLQMPPPSTEEKTEIEILRVEGVDRVESQNDTSGIKKFQMTKPTPSDKVDTDKETTSIKPSSVNTVKPVKKTSSHRKVVSPQVRPVVTSVEFSANKSAKIDVSTGELSTQEAVNRLIRTLEERIKQRPADSSTLIKLKLLRVLLGKSREDITQYKKQNGPEADKLSADLAKLISIFENSTLSTAEQANQALDVMSQIQEILKKEADLKIVDLKLCSEVLSFGTYKLLPANYFIVGRKLPVIVYIELENFTSRFNSKKRLYETLLSMTIEIIKEDESGGGYICWRHHDENIKDISRKRRRDFYIARLITLPAHLPAGKLTLKVTIEDHYGNKVTQKAIDFSMQSK